MYPRVKRYTLQKHDVIVVTKKVNTKYWIPAWRQEYFRLAFLQAHDSRTAATYQMLYLYKLIAKFVETLLYVARVIFTSDVTPVPRSVPIMYSSARSYIHN